MQKKFDDLQEINKNSENFNEKIKKQDKNKIEKS